MKINRRRFIEIMASSLALAGCSNDINLDNPNKKIKSLGLNDNSKRGYKTLEELAQESITEIEPLKNKLRNRLIGVKNPIKISSYEDFKKIGRDSEYPLTADYILTQDIDWKGGELEQIGDKDNQFSGIFNGNNCEISNFVLGSSSESGVALFDSTTRDAIIANIGLKNLTVSGNKYVSGLVSINEGTLFNCYLENGSVTGNYQVSGLCCKNLGNIINSYIGENLTINGIGNNSHELCGILTGGLVANNFRGNIINCYTKGKVIGNAQVGGIVALTNEGIIRKCYSDGEIIGNLDIGGIAGSSMKSIFLYCRENKNTSFKDSKPTIVGEIKFGLKNKGTMIGYGHNSVIIYDEKKVKEWVDLSNKMHFIKR